MKTYGLGERPGVLVHVDQDWLGGELQQWALDRRGGWWGTVAWRDAPGALHLSTFPAHRVWEDREDADPLA